MSELNLYQKLAKIRESVEVMQRNSQGYGYNYVSDTDLLANISVGMKEYGVSLIPEICHETMNVDKYEYSKIKNGKSIPTFEILVSCEMNFVWVNNDNPDEKIIVPWAMVGQQSDASQSFGSGLTYSYRYFLLKYFSVATPNDDPDYWRSKQKQAEAEAEQRIKAEANKEINGKRKEITDLGKKAIASKIVTGAELRELIQSINEAGGTPGDIESVEIADKVISAIKALPKTNNTKKEKSDA